MSDYAAFLDAKLQLSGLSGFAATVMPSWLFDFQSELVEWATRKGRAAIFAHLEKRPQAAQGRT